MMSNQSLSKYEQIRENNMREIREAMAATLDEIVLLKKESSHPLDSKTGCKDKPKKKDEVLCQLRDAFKGQLRAFRIFFVWLP